MIRKWIELTRRKKEKGNNYWTYYYKLGKLVTNLFFPIQQWANQSIGVESTSDVVVSLTSFPPRINTVWVTIASVMKQYYKPKRIILWLAEEQFPDRKVPHSLKRLVKRGLEIKYCDDLKPHKKYFYTLQECQNEIVITVDDDILYPEDFIETLVHKSTENPGCVVCHWSHKILSDNMGNFGLYNDWPNTPISKPSFRLLPVGCNGVLYPPSCLSSEIFDKEKMCRLAPFTDDLWLKCMGVLNGTKAVNCDKIPIIYFENVFAQRKGLWKSNAASGINRNDLVWNILMNEYPEVKRTIVDEEE